MRDFWRKTARRGSRAKNVGSEGKSGLVSLWWLRRGSGQLEAMVVGVARALHAMQREI
jgi:hypothetical protein